MADSRVRRRLELRQFRRGFKFRDRFQLEKSGAAFAKAARSADPELAAKANFWLGGVREDLGEIEDARAAYDAVLDSGVPGYGPNAGVLLAKMLMAHSFLDEAQSALERAVAYREQPLRPRPADPTQPVRRDSINWPFHAAVGLEVLMVRRGDEEGAERARELSYELHESDEPAQIDLNRGERFNAFDRPAEARKAYEQAMSANHPRWSPLAAHALGGVLKRQGDAEGAIEAYERAMAFDDPRIASSAKMYIEMIREEHPASGHR